jgi:hypothetical protein
LDAGAATCRKKVSTNDKRGRVKSGSLRGSKEVNYERAHNKSNDHCDTPVAPSASADDRAGVFFVYAGAACSHYSVGDGPDKVGMPVLFAVLTLISSGLWASSKLEVGR